MAVDVGRQDFRAYISGLSEYAETWAQTLNALTLRTNLEQCTLLPLRGVVSPYKLMAGNRRYCPQCLKDDDKWGRGRYERLLWTIDCVVACPLHGIRLVTWTKDANQKAASRASAADSERVVSKPATLTDGVPATEYESNCARLVANLLDDADAFPDMQFSDSAQAAFLDYLIGEQFEGQSAPLADHLRVGKSQVHGWRTGMRMSLPRLALVAFCSGCAIADIILGNQVHLSLCPAPSCGPRTIAPHRCTGAKRPRDELAAAVTELANDETVRFACAAAEKLRVSRKFLKKNFPAEYDLFVTRGLQYVATTKRDRLAIFSQAYLTAFVGLHERGIYPSRRKCLARMPPEIRHSYSLEELIRVVRNAHATTGVPMRQHDIVVS